ncbi:MAG: hypothetical protein A3A97_04165 [Candidatus Terrybacteria bacterium RIFCSPLOWO2_01_FULL_40_23]|uniref:TIGR00725 family protein n=1 Tax=Candidatus Terrybacteria bacterium RIFCSPLOWO2_01_FULL_40_23 TaxID=1802366 RepID=A0A1G2PS92_9BACT|nr:MAG: hypothetical protein UT82_C0004G0030 [Parcubacteria group bacterium GW2011_GWB1_40_14]OHA50619.1 MAG: hypothetical protein A3A97_04165 [Candidatus Terrybacteria bacterium RIFCSPLOWO2_01_FULL_40_23]
MPHHYQKYKICVSGAAETDFCTPEAIALAKEIGREIVRQGAVLVTGATNGMPYWAAIGAKEEGGLSIGLSPAASEEAHVKSYHLPIDYFDIIIYTGFDYSGRNLLLTRAADAVIIICGRMGTLNEFTIAFEDKKAIGVMVGSGGLTEIIKDLVAKTHRGSGDIIYDSNPKRLIEKVIKKVEEQKKELNKRTQKHKKKITKEES